MVVRSATTGDDLDAAAGGDLIADTLTVGGLTLLQSGGALSLATLNGGDAATLNSGGTMTLGDLVLTAGDLRADADAGLTLTGHADVQQGDATLQAAGSMRLNGPVHGGDITMLAGGPLQFTTVDARGDVRGQSLNAGIAGNGVSASDSVSFLAEADIRIDTLRAGTDIALDAGGDVDMNESTAGRDVAVLAGGDIAMTTTQAGRTASVDAGGGLDVGSMQAGVSLGLVAQHMRFDTLIAPTETRALARTGGITGAELITNDADIAAFGAIQLDAAAIGDRVNLAANAIDVHIRQTRSGQPLYSVLTGFQGGVAQRITADVDAPERWTIDRLAALDAGLTTAAPSVHIEEGRIEQTMSLSTSEANLWMSQSSASLQTVDVQLIQPSLDFRLYQAGKHTLSDAFIVRYDYGYEVETPNYLVTRDWRVPYYQGESAMRFNSRVLAADVEQGDDDDRSTSTSAANAPGDRPQGQPAPGSIEIAVNVRIGH
jgi:hypothetical protein